MSHPRNLWLVPLTAVALSVSPLLYASGDHSPKKRAGKEDEHGHAHGHDEENGDAHGDEHGEDHGDEHGSGHEEEEGGRFGAGKAILAASKKDGIQLSDAAVKTLGLGHMTLSGTSPFKVPVRSLVFFLNEVGIYRLKNGRHKLIELELVSKTASEAIIRTSELKAGDQIVNEGVPLLRAAELEAWGGSGDGHGH